MRYLALLIAFLLAGCGAQAAGPSTVTAASGQFRSEASPARLNAGGTVHFSLTVSGPIRYEAGCAHTLGIWAVDGQNRQVWAQPFPMIACFALQNKSIPAGQTASFAVEWPVASTLAPGPYTIHGLVLTVLPPGAGARVRENVPPLTIEVTQ